MKDPFIAGCGVVMGHHGWVAGFVVGQGYAWYEGPSSVGGVHRHAAFQVAVAVGEPVTIVDAAGVAHSGVAVVVPPMVPHRLLATPLLRTFFVESRSAFADRLRVHPGVTVVPGLRGLTEERIRAGLSRELDPRLLTAMEILTAGRVPMPELAAAVGFSPQRLWALARAELGLPLSSWHTWHCLRRAAEALRAGRSPAAAAVAGGFADQAHFTRRMREMMGLTPATVLRLLRAAGGVHGDRTSDG